MDQRAYSAIAALYNAYPAQSEDIALRLKTMEAVLEGTSTEAICEAAKRFVMGSVVGQSLRFAPSVPEFVQEARKRQDMLDIASRPKIEGPRPEPKPFSPPVRQEALQALSDALAGRRSIDSVHDEFIGKTEQN